MVRVFELDASLLRALKYETLRNELLAAKCAAPFKSEAEKSIPKLPELFRFPFGTCDQESLDAVNRYGIAGYGYTHANGGDLAFLDQQRSIFQRGLCIFYDGGIDESEMAAARVS